MRWTSLDISGSKRNVQDFVRTEVWWVTTLDLSNMKAELYSSVDHPPAKMDRAHGTAISQTDFVAASLLQRLPPAARNAPGLAPYSCGPPTLPWGANRQLG